MGFKKYIIASVVLMGIIAGYVFALDIGDYTLQIANIPMLDSINYSQTLPVYIWIILPTLLLFVASILHMLYYNAKNYFIKKSIDNDIKLFPTVIKDRLLKNSSSVRLKDSSLKEIANILEQVELNLIDNKEIDTNIKDIQELSNELIAIANGKYSTSKLLKSLDSKNPLIIKNLLNRIESDDNFAVEVLKNNDKYDDDIVEIAFKKVIETKSFTTLKKLVGSLKMNKSMVKLFLQKDSKAPKEASLTNSEILVYIQDTDFTNPELIAIAKNYKSHISPEQLIKLFEDIAANNESLTESYLYVLFEFEMIEQIREILLNSQKDEHIIFKALLDLKEAGKHYSIDSLVIK